MQNEIFAKTLGETDVNKRCAVPMKYFKMKRFPKLNGSDNVDFVVKDESGQDHILCCSKRKMGNDPNRPKHPKPALVKGWIPFVRKKKLSVRDRVIIYEEQDETGFMQRRIKVEKRTSWSPVMSQNHGGIKGSNTNNKTFQALGFLSSDVLNPDLSGIDDATNSSIEEEQIPAPRQHFSDTASHKIEGQSLSLNLELTLKPTMTWGSTAATSSSIHKEQTPLPHSTSQLTSKPSMTVGQQHACMQETELKTIDFLGSFL
ncbi:hypothetical protein DITRI_Ditri12bG0124400 [Diplodiscus trichospermus]